MQAIEFTTQVKSDHKIRIPERFSALLKDHMNIRVIVLFDEDQEPDPDTLLLKQYLEESIEDGRFEEM